MAHYHLSHLDLLEHEAVHILREAAAQFAHAAILFSGGKDSLALAALARKAFAPARPLFPLLHIDTGHNFPETLAFRSAPRSHCSATTTGKTGRPGASCSWMKPPTPPSPLE